MAWTHTKNSIKPLWCEFRENALTHLRDNTEVMAWADGVLSSILRVIGLLLHTAHEHFKPAWWSPRFCPQEQKLLSPPRQQACPPLSTLAPPCANFTHHQIWANLRTMAVLLSPAPLTWPKLSIALVSFSLKAQHAAQRTQCTLHAITLL